MSPCTGKFTRPIDPGFPGRYSVLNGYSPEFPNFEKWRRYGLSKYGRRGITAALLVVLMLSLIRLVSIVPQRINKDDFSHYYIATRIFLSGHVLYGKNLIPLYEKYGFNAEGNQQMMPPYPPAFYCLFAPFASLNPHNGFMLWFAFELACLFGILLLSAALLKEYFPLNGWLLFFLVMMLSAWTYNQFYYSQVGLFLAALVLAAFALNRKERHNIACILVSLAGLIKLFPFVFLPWFLWRKKKIKMFPWRQMIISGVFILAVIFLSGFGHWIDYYTLSVKSEIANSYAGRLYNYSLPSFLVNIFYAAYFLRLPADLGSILIPVATFFGLALMCWGYFICFRARGNRALEFSLLSVVILLGIPRSFGHYMVFLFFPIAVATVHAASAESRKPLLLLGLSFLLLNLQNLEIVFGPFHVSRTNLIIIYLLNYVPFFGLLGLLVFIYACIMARKDASPGRRKIALT